MWPDTSVWLCLKMPAWVHLSSSLRGPSAAFLTGWDWGNDDPSCLTLEFLMDDTVSDWTSTQSSSWLDSAYEWDGCVGQCVKLVLCSAGLSISKQSAVSIAVFLSSERRLVCGWIPAFAYSLVYLFWAWDSCNFYCCKILASSSSKILELVLLRTAWTGLGSTL